MIQLTIDPSIIAIAFATERNDWYEFLARFKMLNPDVYPPNPQIVMCIDFPQRLLDEYKRIVNSLDYDASRWYKDWYEKVEVRGSLLTKSGVFEFDEAVKSEFAENNDEIECNDIDQIIITLAIISDKVLIAESRELDRYGIILEPNVLKPSIEAYLNRKSIKVFNVRQANDWINKQIGLSSPQPSDHIQLCNMMFSRFNMPELRNLCFYVEIPFDDLKGSIKREKIIEIIDHCRRHDLANELIKMCGKLHPEVTWQGIRL